MPIINSKKQKKSKSIARIKIRGEFFDYLKSRYFSPVEIYQGNNKFLRIGNKKIITKELSDQKNLKLWKFPVPKIISHGKKNGFYYFTERSLGTNHFENIFLENIRKKEKISSKNFIRFLFIVKKYALAQINYSCEHNTKIPASESILREKVICQELPEFKNEIKSAYRIALKSVSELPIVPTHGDFRPLNILPKGVIDWENFAWAPLGYDLITNIYTTNIVFWGQNEYFNKTYKFTNAQITEYFSEIDDLFYHYKLPKLSEYKDHLILLRIAWATVKMHRWPKLQEKRYKLFKLAIKKYLSGYKISELIE